MELSPVAARAGGDGAGVAANAAVAKRFSGRVCWRVYPGRAALPPLSSATRLGGVDSGPTAKAASILISVDARKASSIAGISLWSPAGRCGRLITRSGTLRPILAHA